MTHDDFMEGLEVVLSNVYTELLKNLDVEIWPRHMIPSEVRRDVILETVDKSRGKILRYMAERLKRDEQLEKKTVVKKDPALSFRK